MKYGENSTAYKLLAEQRTEQYIRSSGKVDYDHPNTVTFSDGSFIELRNYGNHQAFLASGWNVTPRDK